MARKKSRSTRGVLDRSQTSVESIADAAVTAGIQGAQMTAALMRAMARGATNAGRRIGGATGETVADAAKTIGEGLAGTTGRAVASPRSGRGKRRSTRRRPAA